MNARDALAREARQLRAVAECTLDARVKYRLLRRANALSVKAAEMETESAIAPSRK